MMPEGKVGGITVERKRMEPPRSMKDDTKWQEGRVQRGDIVGINGKEWTFK
jgi:hypothetical protein